VVGDADVCARFRQRFDAGETNRLCAAGDHRDAAIETEAVEIHFRSFDMRDAHSP